MRLGGWSMTEYVDPTLSSFPVPCSLQTSHYYTTIAIKPLIIWFTTSSPLSFSFSSHRSYSLVASTMAVSFWTSRPRSLPYRHLLQLWQILSSSWQLSRARHGTPQPTNSLTVSSVVNLITVTTGLTNSLISLPVMYVLNDYRSLKRQINVQCSFILCLFFVNSFEIFLYCFKHLFLVCIHDCIWIFLKH